MMVAVAALLLLLLLLGVLFKRGSHAGGTLPLPPGSMGWPWVGETFELYSENPNVFFRSQEKKYGPIFKTRLLGNPCVMLCSSEATKLVLVTHPHLFKPTFPASKEKLIGKHAVFFHHGDYHTNLRKLVLRALTPDTIKRHFSSINSIAADFLPPLEGHDTHFFNTFHEMKMYAFNVGLLAILGEEHAVYRDELRPCYEAIEKGYNSMPINLPGTLFRKAMKARKHLGDLLIHIISERRIKKRSLEEDSTGDLLQSLMGKTEALSDEQIADNIIGVIFASRDTTASVLTWIVKFLADNPAVLAAVTEEYDEIIRKRKEGGCEGGELLWEETRSMPVSMRVINETMRMASIIPFTFREAVEDVNLNGYFIPKGWKVMPLFRNIHHSSRNFSHPGNFDPSRFEVSPKPNTFLAFGSGIHHCPGNEFARTEMLVMMHHLTTKYRWSLVQSNEGVRYGPFPIPSNGLPILLRPKGNVSNLESADID